MVRSDSSRRGTTWRGTAFGLDLLGNFPAPGLDVSRDGGRSHGPTELWAQPVDELDRHFDEAGGKVAVETGGAGRKLTIQHDPDGNALLHSDFFGRFRVSLAGRRVESAPRPAPDWLWQRFLIGQVLPLAAVLQGLEPLHASAVDLEGAGTHLFIATSGTGKTSVALHCLGQGGSLLADDVAALEVVGGQVVAHPAPSLASLGPAEVSRLPERVRSGWTPLGRYEGEERGIVDEVCLKPQPVAGVYLISRREGLTDTTIEEAPIEWGPTLLGATFNGYIQDPPRLARQLDLCASLARQANLRVVNAPVDGSAAALAKAIGDHARKTARRGPAK